MKKKNLKQKAAYLARPLYTRPEAMHKLKDLRVMETSAIVSAMDMAEGSRPAKGRLQSLAASRFASAQVAEASDAAPETKKKQRGDGIIVRRLVREADAPTPF